MICGEKPANRKSAFFSSEIQKMADDKHLDEKAKEHWNHKPYSCDFGGAKDETLRQ